MPPPPLSPSAASQSAESRLSALTEALSCPICHALLCAPVQLPCAHMFCSECIRRHLSTSSTCAQPFCRAASTTSSLVPLRALDTALAPFRNNHAHAPAPTPATITTDPKTYLVFHNPRASGARAAFERRLRAHGLPATGPLDALAARDRLLVLKWNAAADAAGPIDVRCITRAVLTEERARHIPPRRDFFAARTPPTHRPQADDTVPQQGDGFTELIRKAALLRRRCRQKHAGEQDTTHRDKATPGEPRMQSPPPSPPSAPPSPPSSPEPMPVAVPVVDEVHAKAREALEAPDSVCGSVEEAGVGAAADAGGDMAAARADIAGIGRDMAGAGRDAEKTGNSEVGTVSEQHLSTQSPPARKRRRTSPVRERPVSSRDGERDGAHLPAEKIEGDTVEPTPVVVALSQSQTPFCTPPKEQMPRVAGAPSSEIPPGSRTGPTEATQPMRKSPASPTRTQVFTQTPSPAKRWGVGHNSQPSMRMPLSDEQQRRIERNKQAAIEKKKRFLERQRLRQMRQPDI